MINQVIEEFSKPESFGGEPFLWLGAGSFSGHLMLGALSGFLIGYCLKFKAFGFFSILTIYLLGVELGWQGNLSPDAFEDALVVMFGASLFFADQKTFYIMLTLLILFIIQAFGWRFENTYA